MFGSTRSSPFGQTNTNPSGSQRGSSTTTFGALFSTPFVASSTPSSFGGSSVFDQKTTQTSPFGTTTQPSHPPLGTNLAFGQSTSAFGSSPSPFGVQSSMFGAQPTMPTFGSTGFGQSACGGQQGGSRVAAYAPTPEPDNSTSGSNVTVGKLESISAMPVYKDKTHEELRWEDYLKGDKGGPLSAAPQSSGVNFTAHTPQSSPLGTPPPFGQSSSRLFSVSSSTTTTDMFGQSVFGQTINSSNNNPFGSTTPSLFQTGSSTQSSSPFSTTTPSFGASSTPSSFGGSSVFGQKPVFGSTSTQTSPFGSTTQPSQQAFGALSTAAFSFSSSPAFGQSTSAFGSSSPFGASPSPFGVQSSMFGAQSTTPHLAALASANQPLGVNRGGSRVAAYAPTPEPNNSTSGTYATVGKLRSISAIPVYKDKSHEELRWEDYQKGDKGGPLSAAPQCSGINSTVPTPQSSPLSPPSPFGQSSSNLFSDSNTMTTNIFGQKNPVFNGASFTTSPSTFSSSPNLFNSPTPSAFATNSNLFAPNSNPTQGSASTFNSTSLFNFIAPPSVRPSTIPSFSQKNIFNNSSSGFSNAFSSTPATSTNSLPQTAPSFSTPFQAPQPSQPAGPVEFSSFQLMQPANASVGGAFGNNTAFFSASQSSAVVHPVPPPNPFGTLPPFPQISIGHGGTSPSVQYGISSMPLLDKPAPVRVSSLLTTRHLSQRRIRLPARKYHPKSDASKVPFFL